MRSTEVIEEARKYFLLSNDHNSKPVLIGNRIQLEFALKGIDSKMIIATSGDTKGKKCLILIDATGDEVKALSQKVNKKILTLKAVN